MWEKVTPFQGKSHCYGVTLHAVWDVEADTSYDICWPRQKEDIIFPGSVAMCYTLEGEGELLFKNGTRVFMETDTAIFAECEQIERYLCAEENWRFHWIEFSSFGSLPLPTNERIDLPRYEMYSNAFYDLTYAIRQNTHAYRQLAAATFTKLIYEWGTLYEDRASHSPHRAKIQMIIGEMHNRIAINWPVSDMAQTAHMSEPAFRQAFRSVTGQSPKKFYTLIRLSMAENLLRKNTLTIAEIADQLGYSDPFHLSKAFKKQYGVSPSNLKNGQN